MQVNRRNVLLCLAILLGGVLAFRLLLAPPGHHAPPQPPLSHKSREAHAGSEREIGGARHIEVTDGLEATPPNTVRPAYDELDLLPLGMSRDPGVPSLPVGPRYAGTFSAEAARLKTSVEAAASAGRFGEATELAQQGLALDPSYPQLLVLAAYAELRQSDEHLEEAERMARRAVAVSPCFAEAQYNLACALARQGQAAGAADALRMAAACGRARNLDFLIEARKDPDFDRVRTSREVLAVLDG